MELKYKAAPHVRHNYSTAKIMMHLTIALLIVYAFALYRSFTLGQAYLIRAIVLMLTSVVVACLTETIWALCTHKNVIDYLKSSFPWVTAIILTLMVPVNTEPYALGVSTFIAIFFGKLVFGGFGQNIFNPAAVGRAIIFSSFAGSISADLITSATPATTLASVGQIASSGDFSVFLNDFGGLFNLGLGMYQGAMGETCSILIIVLGIYLTIVNVIDWRIPVTYLGVMFFGSLFVGMGHGLGFDYALYSILTGGAMFGAVFMLTDPVTNPTTRAGKIVFASIAAVITIVIRYYANLPEGVLFSILFANMLTPIIDKFFAGKQVARINKNIISTFGMVILSVVLIVVMGLGLESKTYTSILVPEFNRGASVSLSDDYSIYKPKLISQDGDTYQVSAIGYGLLGTQYGGAGGESHTGDTYKRNEMTIVIDSSTNTVVSVEITSFGDTTGIGDKVDDKGFYYQFIGADLDSDVDVVSGATYTSKSVNAAVNFVLNGCPEPAKINDDYSAYSATITDATVNDNGDETYHVSVRGYGLLDVQSGGAGGVSHTGDTYTRNEFDITVKDGKIDSIVLTHFGDTTGIGDKVDDAYLESFNGKGIDDSVDLMSGATYTSLSAIAAAQAVLSTIIID